MILCSPQNLDASTDFDSEELLPQDTLVHLSLFLEDRGGGAFRSILKEGFIVSA